MIQNEVVEAINSTEMFQESLDGKKYIEMYCSPLLFEWLSSKVQIRSSRFDLVTTIFCNTLQRADVQSHLNSMCSIRGKSGRIFLSFSTLKYFPDDIDLNELRSIFEDFISDLSSLGYKGIIHDIENQNLLIPINVELEYSTKNEFVDLVRVAVRELFGSFCIVSELPKITAARVITRSASFVITPYSGCYDLASMKEYLKANLVNKNYIE